MFTPLSVSRRTGCNHPPLDRLAIRCAIVIVIALVARTARATNYTWNAPGGGTFQTTTNWLPNGSPTISDTVIFGNPTGAYTVTLSAPVTMTGLQVSQGTPTLSINPQAFSVFGSNGFSVGTTAAQTAHLKITSGTFSLAQITP